MVGTSDLQEPCPHVKPVIQRQKRQPGTPNPHRITRAQTSNSPGPWVFGHRYPAYAVDFVTASIGGHASSPVIGQASEMTSGRPVMTKLPL